MALCTISIRRPAANAAAALPPHFGRGFYIPVILATAGIHRRESGDIIAQAIIAAFLPFARSANHLAKQDGKMRLCVAPQNAAGCCAAFGGGNYRRLSPPQGFAIFGNKLPFALSRKLQNGKRVDSRSRENDGDIKSPSNSRRLCRR